VILFTEPILLFHSSLVTTKPSIADLESPPFPLSHRDRRNVKQKLEKGLIEVVRIEKPTATTVILTAVMTADDVCCTIE
jgi:hypothetical protein